MINEEATFEKFGYHNYDLKPKSNKKIVAVCDDCGKMRIFRKMDYRALVSHARLKANEKARTTQIGRTVHRSNRIASSSITNSKNTSGISSAESASSVAKPKKKMVKN